jgi:hypothetical protein
MSRAGNVICRPLHITAVRVRAHPGRLLRRAPLLRISGRVETHLLLHVRGDFAGVLDHRSTTLPAQHRPAPSYDVAPPSPHAVT